MARIILCIALILIPVLITGACIDEGETEQNTRQEDEIMLPEPRTTGEISIEEAMLHRRSVRRYTKEAITLNDLSQLLWAAQGITSGEGFRTAPSAGALYPLEVYVVAGNVDGLAGGVYRYRVDGHTLQRIRDGDLRGNLSECALKQTQIPPSTGRGASGMPISRRDMQRRTCICRQSHWVSACAQ